MDAVVIFGFVAAVLGGLDSFVGAVVGGIVLGSASAYVASYVGSELVTLAALAILVVVLLRQARRPVLQLRRPGGSDAPVSHDPARRPSAPRAANTATPTRPPRRDAVRGAGLPGATASRPAAAGRLRRARAAVLALVNDFRATQIACLAAYVIAAAGLTVLTGLNGQVSLGHGALMAVGAYTAALLLAARTALPFPVIVLVAVVTPRSSGRWSAWPRRDCTARTWPAPPWRWRSALPGLAISFDGRCSAASRA